MTVPAERLYRHVIMTLITELLLIGVALHAAVLQAHIEFLMVRRADVLTVHVTDHGVAPEVDKLHVLGPHEFLRFNTLLLSVLLFPFLDRRGIHLRLGLGVHLSAIVV